MQGDGGVRETLRVGDVCAITKSVFADRVGLQVVITKITDLMAFYHTVGDPKDRNCMTLDYGGLAILKVADEPDVCKEMMGAG